MNLYWSLIVYSTDTFSGHYCLYPININDNIFYKGILKHRKNACDSLVIRDEAIALESFSFKIIYVLRDIIIDHLTFL